MKINARITVLSVATRSLLSQGNELIHEYTVGFLEYR